MIKRIRARWYIKTNLAQPSEKKISEDGNFICFGIDSRIIIFNSKMAFELVNVLNVV